MSKEDITEYEEDERPGMASRIAMGVAGHPRIFFGSFSSVVGIGFDVVYHEPLWMLFGFGIAAALGLTSDQGKMLRHIALGADHDPGDTISEVGDTILGEAPEDQSWRAKLARLFQQKENTSLPQTQKKVRELPDTGLLTQDRILKWFLGGVIDEQRFTVLMEYLEKSARYGNRSGNGNGVIVEHEAASEEVGSTQMESLRPPEWTEEKEHQLIGAYLALGAQSKSILTIGLSDSQRNRDYAREVLKRSGFLKGKL